MKKILVTITIVLSLGLITGCGCGKKIKENKNENVIKDQTIDVFNFTNTSLKYENGTSVLETKVTNNSSETQYLKEFEIIVKNKDNSTIVVLIGYVGDKMDAKDSKIIRSSYGMDLTNAYSIEYKIKK